MLKYKLAANMYFNVELQVANSKGLALPEEAIVTFEGKDFVFEQLSAKEFKLISIQKGSMTDGKVEILTQLPAGKKYVTKGSYQLLTALKNNGEE